MTSLLKRAQARIARLYSVIVPALIVTLLLDTAGSALFPAAYDGWWYSGEAITEQYVRALTFTTQVDDEAVAGPDHPIRVVRDHGTGEPSPYVLIRSNLWALMDRKSFYRLIDLGCHADHDGHKWFGLWSSGQFFPVIPSSELP